MSSPTMPASEARKNLFPLIEEVNNDRTTIHITSKRGNAVLMSEDDYNSWQETMYLLRSPANAAWLSSSIAQAETGDTEEHELIE